MLIIKNANVIDPVRGEILHSDIFIKNGKLASIGEAPSGFNGAPEMDAAGLYAAPGLVDMHVHLREPGFEYKEDIESGAMSALFGGITAAAAMPNTNPVIDTPETLRFVLERARRASITVLPIAAVTVGQKGERLCDFEALRAAGAVAFSDDGRPVSSEKLMRAAMLLGQKTDAPVISHCEIASMTDGKHVNEGRISHELGLPGRPAEAEELMVLRDCELAIETGARVHIAHVSTAKSVDIIRKSKAAGALVSAESCPQYFSITEDAVLELGPLAKVNPPLRTREDVRGIIQGLIDGTIDVIASDHAPHSAEEKSGSLVDAPAGMIGLETSFALALTKLYHTGKLGLVDIVKKMALNPARILGIKNGTLEAGADADIVLFDPEENWTVQPELFKSKARNTPFGGMALCGRVKYTIAAGRVTRVS